MTKDSKGVRFKGRPGSAKSKSSRASTKKASREQLNDPDDSPIDSLTTNIHSQPASDTDPEPEVRANIFSRIEDRDPREPVNTPDKPSLYDKHDRELGDPPEVPDPPIAFVDTIIRPSSNKPEAIKVSPIPDKPIPFSERINQLEITHIGKELKDFEADNMETCMFTPRSENELQVLTERLHSYISRMRELRTGGAHVDTNTFFKSVDAMEREIKNVKTTYEREILKLRNELEDVSRARNNLELRNSKLEATASDLQTRISAEVEANRRMNDDIKALTLQIQRKELEFQQTVQQSMVSDATLVNQSEGTKQLDQTLRENMDLHRKYEAELLQRRNFEDKAHRLQEQIEFSEQLHKQQLQDLQDRLAAASNAILNLEGKVRVLNRPDQDEHISQMIASVRDAAERELYKYKQDSEDTFSRNITMLKAQMDSDRKSFEAVTEENRKLTGVIEELNTKIRNLQGENIHVTHGKRSAEENMQVERDRSIRHIQALEGKLKDLQDMLFDKMKELNAARIQNLPLKAEVESLRALMEEEEKRLAGEMKLPPLSYAVNRSTISGRLHDQLQTGKTETTSALAGTGYGPPTAQEPTLPGGTDLYTTSGNGNVAFEMDGAVSEGACIAGHAEMTGTAGAVSTDGKAAGESGYCRSEACPLCTPRVGPVRTKSNQSLDGTATYQTSGSCGLQNSLNVHDSQKTTEQTSPEFETITERRAASAGEGREASAGAGRAASTVQGRAASAGEGRAVSGLSGEASVTAHDYNHCTNSATGELRIHELSPDGRSLTIFNMSKTRDIEIGQYIIQQNVGGNPVAVFRFPPRTTFKARTFITVYSGCNDLIHHQPPTQFVWKEQQLWGTGPECTTVLCKPNGQAIAWSTAAHRFSAVQYKETQQASNELPVFERDPNEPAEEAVYLRREKEPRPCLSPPKHPHGAINSDTHPQVSERREKELGNDNSSNQRQSRVMSQRPDLVPGEPYSGKKGQHMGTTSERRYTSRSASGQIRKSGAMAKQAELGKVTDPPSSFMTPKHRHQSGIQQILSAHHVDFNPPMPRPPLFSAW